MRIETLLRLDTLTSSEVGGGPSVGWFRSARGALSRASATSGIEEPERSTSSMCSTCPPLAYASGAQHTETPTRARARGPARPSQPGGGAQPGSAKAVFGKMSVHVGCF